MSVTFAQAYETAKIAVGDGLTIYSASESPTRWFFHFGTAVKLGNGEMSPVGPIPGYPSLVAISKSDGNETPMDIPGIPSFVTGDPQTSDEAELEASVEVPLPA